MKKLRLRIVTKQVSREADFNLIDEETAMLTFQGGRRLDDTFHNCKTEEAVKERDSGI